MTNKRSPVHEASANTAPRTNEEWWRGAAIYQVYPRSFCDTNGNGVGDLKGVIDRMDYIASLNVDGIWLSPFFTSPMRDFGYDIANYKDVDPTFGTLDDFDALVAAAHAHNLKVIIDQIYAHTSDNHPWFADSRQSCKGAKADWYVWADAKKDGTPPNNWQSVFGGPAWSWDARRRQYYLHSFLKEQPHLNLHNEAVQEALLDVARFWLDRGVDGFRLDAINFALHDPQLRDNPPATGGLSAKTRSYDFQLHRYDHSQQDVPLFLEKLRALTDDYDGIFTVAEIAENDPLKDMKRYTEGEKRLSTAYSFDFLYAEQLSGDLLRSALNGWANTFNEGWPSFAFSNHDAPRAVTRWFGDQASEADAKLLLLLLAVLRGNVFLYQGEELGLPQGNVPFEQLQDPEAIENWPLTLGRDGARTPMPWLCDTKHGGFTTGDPWLPVDPRHIEKAVDYQEAKPTSVLHFAREVLAFRKNSAVLRVGDLEFLTTTKGGCQLLRKTNDAALFCAFNWGEEQMTLAKPIEQSGVLLAIGDQFKSKAATNQLQPHAGVIAQLP